MLIDVKGFRTRRVQTDCGARTGNLLPLEAHATAQISTVIGIINGLPRVDRPRTRALKITEVRTTTSSFWLHLDDSNTVSIGSAPSSAPENVGLSAYVNKLAKSSTGLELYIDYHSYSQLFMTRTLHQPIIERN